VTQAGPLPALHDGNRFFWTAGAEGELRFLRCRDCGHYMHPPRPRCASCRGEGLAPETVSGRASVATFTINHQPWTPGMEVPFVVAIVELPEQQGLRLMTNLVGCAPEDVRIGMPVQVVFEQHEDVWLPYFEPAEEA
jgi:uncharacterized OB-fold protein